jgi:hypothetical protein
MNPFVRKAGTKTAQCMIIKGKNHAKEREKSEDILQYFDHAHHCFL